MYPFYLGIDLHLKRTYMVMIDAKGEVVEKERISNQNIKEYLQKNQRYLRSTGSELQLTVHV